MAQSAQSAEGDLLNQLSLAPLHKEADAQQAVLAGLAGLAGLGRGESYFKLGKHK